MYSQVAVVSFFERGAISAEARLYFNPSLEDVPIEINGSYNFRFNDIFEPYGGISFQLSPFVDGDLTDGFYLHGSFKLRPFEKMQQLSII